MFHFTSLQHRAKGLSKLAYTLLLGLAINSTYAQKNTTPIIQPTGKPQITTINGRFVHQAAIPASTQGFGTTSSMVTLPSSILPINNSILKSTITRNNKALLISGSLPNASIDLRQQSFDYLQEAAPLMGVQHPEQEFILISTSTDELGMTHFKFQQQFEGITIYDGQVILHAENGIINRLNGRYFPTPTIATTPVVSQQTAIGTARAVVQQFTTIRGIADDMQQYALEEEAPTLIIIHNEKEQAQLVWKINIIPHIMDNWDVFVDAQTGEVLQQINKSCSFIPEIAKGHSCHHNHSMEMPPPNNHTTANATDLKGISRNINVFQDGGNYYMVDAGRPMYDNSSDFPDNMSGAIITVDANNTNPANSNFSADFITSTNNTWSTPKGVSAHYHSGVCYEYFRQEHNRNSINGQGGNIVAFINVADSDGSNMDNAFWNGAAMFYGNGASAFNNPLQKSLDVGGHEMTHGVVGSSAGLIYQNQPGALNESMADVFGVLISPENWQLGEDIVSPSQFPSGALRDMANPNQGGSSLSHPGWQPAHMNEYQNLPNTPQGDNGGVHINSGIPNRAFYLYATAVGMDNAADVYYRALTVYMTNNSQFIDARIAVIQAATDLFGAGSNQVTQAGNAFDQVGIYGGSGSNPTDDLETNPGDDFILLTDNTNTNLYVYDGTNFPQISGSQILSRPSITDNGQFILFVDNDNTIQVLEFNYDTGAYDQYYLENNPQTIWRNVAIAKDGSRIAALTTDYDNSIYIFDFATGNGAYIDIYNPTSQSGIFTDDVQYADFIEWDYSSQYLLYDAYNELSDAFGNTSDYWDIGQIKVWDTGANYFGDASVTKLFAGLPDNTGVGNPSFSKNSPTIIAFDYIKDAQNFTNFAILAVNYETGDVEEIFSNAVLGYPTYSITDEVMLFDAQSQAGDQVIASIPLAADKISPAGDASIFINNARWGIWFALGSRDLLDANDINAGDFILKAMPNPIQDQLTLHIDSPMATDATIRMVDITGKVLQQWTTSILKGEQQTTQDVSSLPSGTYFIQVVGDNIITTLEVVKL